MQNNGFSTNKSRWIAVWLMLEGSCSLWSVTGMAATTPAPLPSAVDPSRVEQRLSQPLETTQKRAAAPEAPASSAAAAIPGAEHVKLTLTKVIIEGSTVYSDKTLQTIFQPYYHHEISLAKLFDLVQALTNKYRNDGYILSKAYLPPQQIKDGVVKVKILEGFIDKVRITGKPGRAAPIITTYGKQVEKRVPLRIADLERAILLANDLPGVETKAVLNPSPTEAGASDLDLVTQFQPIKASISYDNYGSRYLGPQELTLTGYLNSLFRSGDANILRAVTTSDTRELKYAQFVHDEPVGSAGIHLIAGGTYTETVPGATLQPLDVQGRSKLAFAGISYPVLRSRVQNLTLQSTFNYSSSSSTLLGAPFYDDQVRYLRLAGQYERVDSWRGLNSLNLGFEQGFDMLDASMHGDLSRSEGRANYTKLDFNASRLQFLTQRLSMQLATQGQYAFMPLLSGQQFGFGGSEFGRGYDPSEITGDRGLAGKMEVRLDTNPQWWLLKTVQFYVFYDIGAIWNIDTSNQAAKASAASAGAGIRFNLVKYLNGNLFIAKPLTRPVSALDAVSENSKSPRGYFSISTWF